MAKEISSTEKRKKVRHILKELDGLDIYDAFGIIQGCKLELYSQALKIKNQLKVK